MRVHVTRLAAGCRVQCRHASTSRPGTLLRAQQTAKKCAKEASEAQKSAKAAEAKAHALSKVATQFVAKQKRLEAQEKKKAKKWAKKLKAARASLAKMASLQKKKVAAAKRAIQKLGVTKKVSAAKQATAEAEKKKKSAVAKRKKAATLLAAAKKAAKVAADRVKREAKAKQKLDRKRKLRESGPVTRYSLFVSQRAKAVKGPMMKEIASEWKGMTEEQRKPYTDEATQNLMKRQEIRQSLKKPPGKYAAYMKQHFPEAYMEVLKSTTNKREAFRLAVLAVARKYKADHHPQPPPSSE